MTDQQKSLEALKRAALAKKMRAHLKRQQAAEGTSPLPLADRQQPLPLSPSQQGLWFLAKLSPAANIAYNMPVALRLEGKLNVPALQQALDLLVARHESLRTCFVQTGDYPRQQIQPADIGFTLRHEDLRHLPAHGRQQRVEALRHQDATQSFDLTTGPLIRGRLVRLSESEHLLIIAQHHLITDGWSVGIMFQELAAGYEAALSHRPTNLPPLRVHYADYAAWQHQRVTSEAYAAQRAFWKQTLAGAPALMTLPTDRPRPPVQRYIGKSVSLPLDPTLVTQLRQFGQRHEASLFMVLMTAWSVLLARISGQDDLVIGTPTANRQPQVLEPLIGFFVNTLALRISLQQDMSVAALLDQVRRHTLEAFAHQTLPFEDVVNMLQPERSLSYNPVVQVMMAYNNTPLQRLDVPDLTLTPLAPTAHSAHFDLTLVFEEGADGQLTGGLEYATDLFDDTSVKRMADSLVGLLSAMVQDDQASVHRLPLLDPPARRQLIDTFNANQRPYPDSALMQTLFEEQVTRQPDAVAIRYDGASLSYDTLNRRANRMAHALLAHGVRPDDRVAICLTRGPAMLIAMLGVLKAGGAYLNLDPDYPQARLSFMIEDATPVACITDEAHQALLHWPTPASLLLIDAQKTSSHHPDQNPDPRALGLTSRHLAHVIYTSGSTGRPKGVMIEHRSVNRLVKNNGLTAITAQDCMAYCANTAFDASTWEVWSTLLNGGQLYLIPQSTLLDPQRLRDALRDGGVTAIVMTTGLFHAYADVLQPIIPQLRYLLVGGDVIDPAKIAQLQRVNAMPQHLINGYGPTEATTMAAAFDVTEPLDATQPVPIGRPLGNTRLYVLDRHLSPVPIGVSGELYIAGPGLARGYLHQPELTAERFLRDPFDDTPGARMYRTGDLARWREDGTLDYFGRNDHQIKLRGFRIELGEIEARLQQYPGVRDATVILREDTPGTQQLVAYLIATPGAELTPAALRQHVRQQLADYMVPAAFMTLTQFPLTPNGKLDRKALPAPDQEALAHREYEAPIGDVETLLAQLWQELLGVPRVGRSDHFFELGGQSLLVVSLIERLRTHGWTLDVSTLFATPVLSALAEAIDASATAPQPLREAPPNRIPLDCQRLTPDMLPLVDLPQTTLDTLVGTVQGGAANVQDLYPLAPLQEGMLFHHLLQTTGDTYLIRCLLGFDTETRCQAFVDALQRVIQRHDVLRTSLYWEALEHPVQVVWQQAPLNVQRFTPDLDQKGDAVTQLLACTDPEHYRLDLRQAPLFSAHVTEDADHDEWLLALSFHHVICDHMTLELLLKETFAFMHGEGETLPTPYPYRHFVAQVTQTPPDAAEAYFRETFAGVDTPTLPFGITDLQNTRSAAIDEAFLTLETSLASAIRAHARRLGLSAGVLFHTACARMLAQLSGQDDVMLGTVLLGRLQGSAGADQVMGLFLNTLPLRLNLAQTHVLEAVQTTYRRLSELFAHEQAPLSLVQRCSDVASSTPLFNTLLNYRHTEADPATWEGIRVIRAQDRTNYPITLSIDDLGTDFRIQSQTVAPLNAERMAHYLATALAGIVDALDQEAQRPMLEVPVLPAQERHRVLTQFNDTAVPAEARCSLQAMFDRQAQRTPAADAMVFGDTSLSYAALNAAANRLAHGLIAQGVRPGHRVVVCLERGFSVVIALLATLKAGATYVPLDPHYPAARLAFMFEDASPTALLTDRACADAFGTPTIPVILMDALPAALDTLPDTTPWCPSDLQQAAYVIYTSGSTGQPKGVEMPQSALINLLHWHQTQPGLSGAGRTLQFAAAGFDVAFQEIFTTLCFGGCLILVDEATRRAPQRLLAYLDTHAVERLFLPFVALQQLADSAATWHGDLAALKTVVTAGEQLHVTPAIRAFLDRAAPCTLYNHYGPTETHVSVTYRLHTPCADWPALPPIGQPIANTQAYVLDHHGHPAPIGVVGMLYLAGQCLANGYLDRPDLTAERFTTPASGPLAGVRLYATGDLARWREDGQLEYLGRNDDQVKLRGFRIELGEIESQLTRCDGVLEAAVVVREDQPGDKRLVAYLRTQDGTASPGSLRTQLGQHLADYMLPSAFVVMTQLPVSPNGKLDRRVLPAPDTADVASRAYVAPQGEIESTLARLWQELLGVSRVGRHDHFFDLGGHSLTSVRLITKIHRAFMIDISVADVFQHPVLADQAQAIFAAQLAAAEAEDGTSLTDMLDNLSAEELAALLETEEG